MGALKFKPGDKCRIKKFIGGGCLPSPLFRVGSLIIIIEGSGNIKWPYYARGMGPNAHVKSDFAVTELELVKRKENKKC